MAKATYVLDKTFRAYGTIGTYRVVTGMVGTEGYCRMHSGTVSAAWATVGTESVLGITQNASKKSGESLNVRMLGISQAYLHAAQGTFPIFGQWARPLYNGKVVIKSYSGGTALCLPSVGLIVGGEGKGSANAYIDIFVLPGYR